MVRPICVRGLYLTINYKQHGKLKLLTHRRRVIKKQFLEALLRNGYLPEEVPPIVTAKFFSEYCKSNYSYWNSQINKLINLNTEYEIFSVPRATTGRRLLAIVNPFAQLGLSLIIAENRTKIINSSHSLISLYDHDENIDQGKAFKGLDFKKWHDFQDEISSRYPYALKADISRFFYTIYTHSIPWAVFGKNKAKKSYRQPWFKSHWSNEIDMALQSCQSRETFGIPVGPDTSRIISEILMSGIEKEAGFSNTFNNSKAVRLIDDIYIGENSRDDAQKTLDAITTSLWKYNLQLNEEKTSISPTKFIFDDYWKRDFEELSSHNLKKGSDKKKIKYIMDAALHHCKNENSELPAIWACRRLIGISYMIEDNASLVDAFFRLGRDYPSVTKHVAEFLVNNRTRLSETEILERIEHWIKHLIILNYENKNDLELSWVLLISGIYGIKLQKEDFPNFEYIPSSVAFSIIGLLRQHGFLQFPLSKWNWRSNFKSGGINGPDWLALYEAVLRKWTKDTKLVGLVNSCPHFSKLLANNISFLDDDILKISKIDFRRRTLQISNTNENNETKVEKITNKWFPNKPSYPDS